MNIGWLLDFYFRSGLLKALRQVGHTAINRAAAAQWGNQPKSNNQSALAAHPESLPSFTQRESLKRYQSPPAPSSRGGFFFEAFHSQRMSLPEETTCRREIMELA